jgi:hypothetical protein
MSGLPSMRNQNAAMKKFLSVLLALPLFWWGGAVRAEIIGCPELKTAVQVGACPSEEDLRYTFKGYCSDDARMYDREEQLCTDFALYRKKKNASLWETPDGRFSGYVSCEPLDPLSTARAVRLAVSKQGSVTRVACGYDTGVTFTHRTKAKCVVVIADCAGQPEACKAECE